MIKNAISIALAAALTFGAITSFAATDFTDLKNDHWAYSSVNTLVSEGTIKGYDDGSFKPDNTVTRAEFVKMIGKGTEKSNKEYSDVPSSHWAYDYVMYSGLAGVGSNNFAPDRAITRGETIELLWKRAGAASGVEAPSVITDQAQNKDAAAWVYTYGVMVGNDGVNLRLDDTLSRAEAAALIIKSRNAKEKISFMTSVSSGLLEYVFNSLKLFDDLTYQPDKHITNIQLSKAMQRYAVDEYELTYNRYYYETPFEGENARDIYILGHEALGEDKITAEFGEKNATIEDTIKAFNSASMRRGHKTVSIGISLYAGGEKASTEPVTQKELTAIILQYDAYIGSQTGLISGLDEYGKYQSENYSIKLDTLPDNYAKYQVITEDIPNEVYDFPFSFKDSDNSDLGVPKAMFDTAREYSSLFMKQCDKLESAALSEYGVKAKFTFYPYLVYDTGSGFAIRIKCDIIDPGTQVKAVSELFTKGVITNADAQLQNGSSFFVEVNTPYAIFN